MTNESPNPSKKRLSSGKKLELRAPWFKYQEGQILTGKITRKSVVVGGRFVKPSEERQVLEIEVTEPSTSCDKKKDPVTYAPGETVKLELKAGNREIWSFPIGTLISMRTVGRVDTGQGAPAWSFDVEYETPA